MTSDHSDDPTGQVPIQPAPEPRQSTEPPAAPPRLPPSPGPAPRPPDADRGRNASLILGLVFLVIGGWFFATTTLGLDLPDLDWGQFWPVILIILGLAIVLRSLDRRRS